MRDMCQFGARGVEITGELLHKGQTNAFTFSTVSADKALHLNLRTNLYANQTARQRMDACTSTVPVLHPHFSHSLSRS